MTITGAPRRVKPTRTRRGTHHPQVTVSVGEHSAEVDEQLAPLIDALWTAGLSTTRSCQRHVMSGKVWIEFPFAEDAETFLAVAVGDDRSQDSPHARSLNWMFGDGGRTSDFQNEGKSPKNNPWEFHVTVSDNTDSPGSEARFLFGISVLFPDDQLATVTERWRKQVGV